MAFAALFPLLIMGIFFGVTKGLLLKQKEQAPSAKKKEPCEFGKENHKYSHDTNRRLVQLQGFYKDGLIDRKEYELLKARWSK